MKYNLVLLFSFLCLKLAFCQSVKKDTLYFELKDNTIKQNSLNSYEFIIDIDFISKGGDYFYFVADSISLKKRSYKNVNLIEFITNSNFYEEKTNSVDFTLLQKYMEMNYEICLVSTGCDYLSFVHVNAVTEIE